MNPDCPYHTGNGRTCRDMAAMAPSVSDDGYGFVCQKSSCQSYLHKVKQTQGDGADRDQVREGVSVLGVREREG